MQTQMIRMVCRWFRGSLAAVLLTALHAAVPATAQTFGAGGPAEPPRDPPLLEVGAAAPDFTCIGGDGVPMKLSELKGKIVILDFWATWCGPCQSSMPHLERVYRQVKGKGVTVLALCVHDDRKLYEAWRVTHKRDFSFPVAFDPAGLDKAKSVPYAAYKVPGIPTQYVIGKDGKIAAALLGYRGGDHRLEDGLAKVGVVVPAANETAAIAAGK